MDGYEVTQRGISSAGYWSRKQLELLGIAWPAREGWRAALRGVDIPEDVAEKFIALKDAHKKPQPDDAPIRKDDLIRQLADALSVHEPDSALVRKARRMLA